MPEKTKNLYKAVKSSGPNQWIPPTVAGPSDPDREAKIWAGYKEKLEKREEDYDGMMFGHDR